MTTKLRPFTLLFSQHAALACLCGFFMALTALSGVALAQNPVPLINQPVVPDTVAPGGTGFTLTVNGTGFVSGSKVNWNGTALATTFVSASQLTASVPASDIKKACTASVTVVNPTPGGGTSNSVFLPISLPVVDLVWKKSAFPAGSGPRSVATGDFNRDGKLDLAVSDPGSGNVSILLGKGNGTFQSPVSYPIGQGLYSLVAVADFNGDGKLDLVASNYASNNVSVLLGNGDGTFQAAVNYDVGTNPTYVAVADLNGDGNLDLAVSNQNCTNGGPPCGTGTVSILLGNGDGTFQPHLDYAAGSNPNSVAVGDFKGDGKLDLAIANGNSVDPSTVSILLGNGDGTFQAPVSYPLNTNGVSVATADFNHDGKLDLAVVDNIGLVSILLGNGDGTFQTRVDYPAGSFPGGIGLGDFNEDGNVDLAVANGGSNTLSVFLGKGDGTFEPQIQISTGANPQGLVAGGFKQDGRLDLAVTNYNNNTVSILWQDGTVSLVPTNLEFGDQLVGSASTKTVKLTNVGSSALAITSIAITGTNAADFNQSNTCPASLVSKAYCTISVTLTPGQLGPLTASITLTDSGPGSPQSVSLSGFGVTSGPNPTLSATQLTFATQLVGTSSSAQLVTLTNYYGTTALSIASIVASGDFSQTNTCGTSLAVGASCTISVTFTPAQIGTRTGTVSITDNAPGSPQTVALNGVGTVVELYPTSLGFGCVTTEYGTTCTPPQTTTLTNTGSAPLTISNVAISGFWFRQTNTCGSEVVAGGSCTFTVGVSAPWGKPGIRYYGALSIYDNGGGSPQTVVLSVERSEY